MKRLNVSLVVICGALVMAGIAIYLPVPSLPTNSDFSAIYNTDLALVNGIPIYDLGAVRAFAQPRSGIPDESFFLARFPYPAWYALSTFYLGFLSPASAATLWFEMNLVMLFVSVWLLSDGWKGRTRLFAFPAAFLFLPVLGALVVGQYDFPVLLGTSLLLYGLKKEKMAAVVCGAMLVTFKPHIGGLIFLFMLIWLFSQGNDFGRHALKYISLFLCGLIVSGFLADSRWISRYITVLLGYQNEGNVTSCSQCISLPMLISRGFFDGSLRTAIMVAGLLLIGLVVFYYLQRSVFMKSAVVFMTAASFAAMLVSPYFYNYDFILLLIPFAVLLEQTRNWGVRIILGLCYLAPYFSLGIYGRNGNAALIVITLILYGLFYLQVKNQTRAIDVPAQPA
jgi:hypothetical protein